MDPLQAIVLGVVQGLTEYLPVSSTAHLRVLPALVGWPDPGAAFSAVVQLGTLLAVVVYFARDVWRLARAFVLGLARRRPFAEPDARLAWMLVLGTLPIGLAGLLFEDAIEGALRSLWVVSGALAALALLLALAERVGRRSTELAALGWTGGLAIGLAQALALVPGVSRSGVTITAGLFAGLTRTEAARFSFLLSMPAVAASGLYELLKLLRELPEGVPWLAVGLGTAAAFASGLGAIAFLMRFLARHTTWVFVIYRLALAGVLVSLLWAGILQP